MAQPNSAEEHKLVSSFEAIKRTLLKKEYSTRLDKPLAYWALPNDRRLPLAFLGRSVGELLSTPFSELTATRGIGQKKISSLVKLLHRATSDDTPAVPYGIKDLAEELQQQQEMKAAESESDFDPALVSEALWVQWCDTVRRFHLERQKLGRLAPSLQALPTVIWNKPLGNYVDRSLAEIRQLRTHGEKRVRVVLEVFHTVHELLANAAVDTHLSIRLVPHFVPEVEGWLTSQADADTPPMRDEVARYLALPLLEQIKVDSGDIVHQLSRDRLGIGAEPKSVRTQADEMNVTRARVYQLLEDCGKVMDVRWPEGRYHLAMAGSRMETIRGSEGARLFKVARLLFYPERGNNSELD